MDRKKSKVRKKAIIAAAKSIFAGKGYQDATISEIAKEAGVSEPTIYEYFPSKEEMLFSIPSDTVESAMADIERSMNMVKGAFNKIRVLVYYHLSLLQTDQEYASVSFLILKQNRNFLDTDHFRTLRRVYRVFNDVLEDGLKSGEIRNEYTVYFIRSIILGTIEHLTTRKVLYGTDDNLIEYMDPLMDFVERALRPDPEPVGSNINLQASPEIKRLLNLLEKKS